MASAERAVSIEVQHMISKTTLSNGLEVILVETTGRAMGISLVGNAGALYATPGLAHFLEHTVLCATGKHPDFLSLANTVDSLGLQRNALTSQETLQFVFRCLPEHARSALEFLSEIATEALLLQSDIEKQRKIVTQEIRRHDSDSSAFARQVALNGLYQGVGPGISVLGTEADVHGISRENLEMFYRKAFVAQNFRLVICGKFDRAKIIPDIESTLGSMPSIRDEGAKLPTPPATNASESPTRTVTRREGISQAVVSMAWKAPTNGERLRHATHMFRALMSEGRMSRLWQALRQRNPLTYTASCVYVRQRSFGYISITAGLAAENVDRAIEEIGREIRNLSEELISDEDLARVRSIVRTSLVFEADSAFDLALYHSSRVLSDPEFVSIDAELAKYQGVTKEDIREVARLLAGQPEHIAIVTP